MSYIIKGILSGELPWGLVLLGVMIAVVLEMSGIPSLAFAVGSTFLSQRLRRFSSAAWSAGVSIDT